MFAKNEGTLDRALRIILGIGLLIGFAMHTEAAFRWAYLIGIIPLVTGLVGSCPLYTLFGLRTCPINK